MNQILKKDKFLYLVLFLCLIIGLTSSALALAKDKQEISFEVKSERTIFDYSIPSQNGILKGQLYELDVLYSGDITEDIIKQYVDTITVSEGTVGLNVKFYNNYNENILSQDSNSLKFEAYIIK